MISTWQVLRGQLGTGLEQIREKLRKRVVGKGDVGDAAPVTERGVCLVARGPGLFLCVCVYVCVYTYIYTHTYLVFILRVRMCVHELGKGRERERVGEQLPSRLHSVQSLMQGSIPRTARS